MLMFTVYLLPHGGITCSFQMPWRLAVCVPGRLHAISRCRPNWKYVATNCPSLPSPNRRIRSSVGNVRIASSLPGSSNCTRSNIARWSATCLDRRSPYGLPPTAAITLAHRSAGSALTSRKFTKLVAAASRSVTESAPLTFTPSAPTLTVPPSAVASTCASNFSTLPLRCDGCPLAISRPRITSRSLPFASVAVFGCGLLIRAVTFTAPAASAHTRTTITWSGTLAKTSRVNVVAPTLYRTVAIPSAMSSCRR